MSCFVVPAVGAIVSHFASKHADQDQSDNRIVTAKHLSWLTKFLSGGSFLLAFEHVWHGELIPAFPFFTAAENPAEMLYEMATAGGAMTLLIVAAWLGLCAIAKKHATNAISQEN